MTTSLSRRVVAEGLGTALLLAVVIGSGIMGERLAKGDVALALLCNAVATGGGLIFLILSFGPISGAHFNPVVTLAAAARGLISWRDFLFYVPAQVLGALFGAAVTHVMFAEPVFSLSTHARAGGPQLLSEFVATFGLLAVIWSCRLRAAIVPFAVSAYIVAAYWFTPSTSFANPAATLARAVSNTFAGIRPIDAPGFIAVQVMGALAATFLFQWLLSEKSTEAPNSRPLPTSRLVSAVDSD
ncbi:MAG: MIP/aquaporin family protein [Myxococcota bacterium]